MAIHIKAMIQISHYPLLNQVLKTNLTHSRKLLTKFSHPWNIPQELHNHLIKMEFNFLLLFNAKGKSFLISPLNVRKKFRYSFKGNQ